MPVTVQTGADSYATARETQRKVFQNPRGLKYRYALLYKDGTGFDLIVRKSVDGITWVDNDTLVMKDFGSNIYDGASLWFWEDAANNQLCIYVVYSSNAGYIWFRKCTIADDSSAMVFGSEVAVFVPYTAAGKDYSAYSPTVCKDRLGYIWCIFQRKYSNKVIESDIYCKISGNEGVTWQSEGDELLIHAHVWDDSNQFATAYPFKSDATRQVYCIYKYINSTGLWTIIEGVQLQWNGTTLTKDGIAPMNPLTDWGIILDQLISMVIDSNNKIIVIFTRTTGQYLKCYSKTIGSAWTQEQDVGYYGSYGFGTFALSIDLTSSPNKLVAFYQINRPAPVQKDNALRYKTSPSTTIAWSTETEILDNTLKITYFSSTQWNSNGSGVKIQVIYTVYTSENVRFYEYSTAAPALVPHAVGDGLVWVQG